MPENMKTPSILYNNDIWILVSGDIVHSFHLIDTFLRLRGGKGGGEREKKKKGE